MDLYHESLKDISKLDGNNISSDHLAAKIHD
jgi:hypothetical protein